MTNAPRLTPTMKVLERQLGRPLADELAERYQTQTLEEIAADLGLTASGMSRWFSRLGIPTSRSEVSRTANGNRVGPRRAPTDEPFESRRVVTV